MIPVQHQQDKTALVIILSVIGLFVALAVIVTAALAGIFVARSLMVTHDSAMLSEPYATVAKSTEDGLKDFVSTSLAAPTIEVEVNNDPSLTEFYTKTILESFCGMLEPADGITAFERLNYHEARVGGDWVGLISGTLPANTPLPATIEIAVPAGADVYWFGKFGRSDQTHQELEFPYPYDFRNVGDFDVYTATLHYIDDVALNFQLHRDPIMKDGENYYINLRYAPWHTTRFLEMSLFLPEGNTLLSSGMGESEFDYTDRRFVLYIINRAESGNEYSIKIPFAASP